MSERDELKPCPFCGGEPGMVQQTKVNWAVMCHVCGAEGGWSYPSDAIALWNRRPTPPQAVPVLTDGWLREFIDERRRLSFNLELHAHETANINLFLDELEKAWRAARA